MNWNAFLQQLNPQNVCRRHGPNNMQNVLGARAVVTRGPYRRNPWYPGGYAGVTDGVVFRGHRYVDMNHSYMGDQNAFCSEANFCAILILIDPNSNSRFLAHISADTTIGDMQVDLLNFIQSIGGDMGRPEMYFFRGTDGGAIVELNLAMALLSSCLSDPALSYLAQSTYFIEGEGALSWRAYSSVYSTYRNGRQSLSVYFAGA